MKKLTETWKQKKPLTADSTLDKDSDRVKLFKTGTKRLGRVVVHTSNRNGNNLMNCNPSKTDDCAIHRKVLCTSAASNMSVNSTFGPDFDVDIISAINRIEQEHAALSPKISFPKLPTNGTAQLENLPAGKYKGSQSRKLLNKSGNSGKRKNSRCRKSGMLMPSVFGETNLQTLLSQSLSPTHSPADKKRKDDKKKSTHVLFMETSPAVSLHKDRMLCPNSTSPECHKASRLIPNLYSRKSCPRVSNSVSSRQNASKSLYKNSSYNEVEIKTDLTPTETAASSEKQAESSRYISRDSALICKSSFVTKNQNLHCNGEKCTSLICIQSGSLHSQASINKPGKSCNISLPSNKKQSLSKEQLENNSVTDRTTISMNGSCESESPVKALLNRHSTQRLKGQLTGACSKETVPLPSSTYDKTDCSLLNREKNQSENYSKLMKNVCLDTKVEGDFTCLRNNEKIIHEDNSSPSSLNIKDSFRHSEKEQCLEKPFQKCQSLSTSIPHRKKSLNCAQINLTPHAEKKMVGVLSLEPEKMEQKEDTRVIDKKAYAATLPVKGIHLRSRENVDNEMSFSQQHPDDTDSLALSAWGLPTPVLEAYESHGVTTMFPWQAQCLTTGKVLDGGNLIYSAPTSAGKTMVAELLILKRVLETHRKALFILPFVSVTREKMISLQRLYQDAGIHVGGFMGSYSPAGGFHSLDVAVCTIEKGNSLVNRLLEEKRIDELGIVVIDELHMVGDSNRGYLLELLLTKICYMACKSRENGSEHPVQVVGMSATLPNLDLLAKWLNADLFRTDFRPVPLTENIKIGRNIYDSSMNKIREIDEKLCFQGDEDHIITLCLETIMEGHSVLIFCPTKAWCEKVAEKIAREFYNLLKNPILLAAYVGQTGFVRASEIVKLPIDQEALQNVLEQLGRSVVGVDPMLGKLVQNGVAYHHAGLTFDERDIVEGAFRNGHLRVLVATSTLSSGVNLPARRVVVRSVMFGGHIVDALSYKQMAGRAGRKGVDTEGESILVCKEGEKKAAHNLLRADLPPVSSCLSCGNDDGLELSRSMKRAILEVVVSGVAGTPAEVAKYAACTLLAASLPPNNENTDQLTSSCLKFLQDNEFVRLQTVPLADSQEVQKYQPTQLGLAVLASSMSPDEGLAVFTELQKARQCFVLSDELHIIYLVTPIYCQDISANLDWYHFYCIWEKLSPEERSIAKIVGVDEGFLARAISGQLMSKTYAQSRLIAIHRRFYTALALNDLVQEMPLLEVARKYNCAKGQLQSLMQSAATFAGMVTVFCARLGWSNLELLLSQFQQRLSLGVTRELCDLVRIPLLTASTARLLFNAGYQTVTALAHACPTDVENVLHKAAPFQSNKKQEGETEWELEQRRKAHCIWLSGRKAVTELEAAIAIIDDAKMIIQEELGVKINWGDDKDSSELATSLLTQDNVHCRHDNEDELAKFSPPVINRTKNLPETNFQNQSLNHSSKSFARKNKSNNLASTDKRTSGSFSGQGNLFNSSSRKGLQKIKHNGKLVRRISSEVEHDSSLKSPLHNFRDSTLKNEITFYGQTVLSPPASLRKLIPTLSVFSANEVKNPLTTVGSQNLSPENSQFHSKEPPVLRMLETCPNVASTNQSSLESVGNSSNQVLAHTLISDVLQLSEQPDKGNTGCGQETELHINSFTPMLSSYDSNYITLENKHIIDEKSNKSCKILNSSFPAKSGLELSEIKQLALKGCEIENAVKGKENRTIEKSLKVDDENIDICFDDSLVLDTQTANLLSDNATCKGKNCSIVSEGLLDEKILTGVENIGKMDHQSPEMCIYLDRVQEHLIQSHFTEEKFIAMGHQPTKDLNQIQEHLIQSSLTVENARTAQCVLMKPACSSIEPPEFHPTVDVSTNNTVCKVQDDAPFSQHTSVLELSIVMAMDQGPGTLQSEIVKEVGVSINDRCTGNAITGKEFGVQTYTDSNNEADVSTELIAASNYERLTFVEEEDFLEEVSFTRNLDTSYEDLCISNSAGNKQLICWEREPEERFMIDTYTAQTQKQANQNKGRPVMDYDADEDLAVAMNFRESFSLTIASSASKASSPVNAVSTKYGIENSSFSDSFTRSMMENALSGNMSFEQAASGAQRSVFESSPQAAKDVWFEKNPHQSSTDCIHRHPVIISPNKALHEDTSSPVNTKNSHISSRIASSPNLASTPQTPSSDSEFIPPTPPGESLNHWSPAVRRTPLRACKNKATLQHKTSQHSSSAFFKEKKRKSQCNPKENKKLMGKENNLHISKNCSPKAKMKETLNKKNLEERKLIQASIQENGTSSLGKKVQSQDGLKSELLHHEDTHITTNQNTNLSLERHSPGMDDNKTIDNAVSCSFASTQESFTIIDVCANADLFSTFMDEWNSKTVYSISVACEKKSPTRRSAGVGIGGKFIKSLKPRAKNESSTAFGIDMPGDDERRVVGLAISWEHHDAYYISLAMSCSAESSTSLDDTMAPPPVDPSISQEKKITAIRNILQKTFYSDLANIVIIYDSKSVYKTLVHGLGIAFGQCRDPQIASWLLDPGGKEKNLHWMVTNLLPEDLPLSEGIGGGIGYGSLGLMVRNPGSGRMRAAAESILSRRLMDCYWTKLQEAGLEKAFLDIEMPSVITLARMEINGFGFSEEECERQKSLMLTKLSALEHQAYSLAGHPFSLTSADDIAQILYLELHLPVNGDTNTSKPLRTLGPSRHSRGSRLKSSFSTNKDVLEKLKSFHSLPGLILEWRRISGALTKQVFPLQKEKVWSAQLEMYRIHGECQLHTATGRVSMMEPNLQSVPKDFDITLPDVIDGCPLIGNTFKTCLQSERKNKFHNQAVPGVVSNLVHTKKPATAQNMAVSMRHAFIPFQDGVLLAADYSQLELRLIAHLSGDKKLIAILNDNEDVFKLIAAQWKSTAPETVTAEQRQQAKQICYGMLYGIGAKAMGEQLGVDENHAAVFMETFKSKYTGLRSYLRKAVEDCREKGYVCTISGRKRFLPAIYDKNPHIRAQAERQAVNTTVQGSAADIVKVAMNNIDKKLAEIFPNVYQVNKDLHPGGSGRRGAFLVLQLHDELIYEVSKQDVNQAARIIKQCMETSTKLLVHLPVKVMVGPSWGRLEEIHL